MYKILYKKIIDNAKSENRQKNDEIYYESHHVTPDFMFKNRSRKGPRGHLDGNPNSIDNLVLLTFQEHLLCHYYLYEIHKGTRYEYAAGSALQFFFVKAKGNHIRQKKLSEIDQQYLDSMAHLRKLGLQSISAARKGKMPVVDSVTREKIGSMPVNHEKVLSGEWCHHSKGVAGHNNYKTQKGNKNNNYKTDIPSQKIRVMKCIGQSIIDGTHLSKKLLEGNIKKEFTEFKKVSIMWIKNRFGGIKNILNEYNTSHNTDILYNPYYRSIQQKELLKQYAIIQHQKKG